MTGSAPDDGVAPYRRIAATIRDRINSGQWPPGQRVPSQHDLAVEFDVARATVQSALRLLAASGLIATRQGAGTFVAETPPPGDDDLPAVRLHTDGRMVAVAWPGQRKWMLLHCPTGTDQTPAAEWHDSLEGPTDLGAPSPWIDPAAANDTSHSGEDMQAHLELHADLARQTLLIRQEMQRSARAVEGALARIERAPFTVGQRGDPVDSSVRPLRG